MMKHMTVWSMLRETFHDWNERDAPRLEAALAFYTILSLAPLVILAVAIAAFILVSLVISAALAATRARSSRCTSPKKAEHGFWTTAFGQTGDRAAALEGVQLIRVEVPKPNAHLGHIQGGLQLPFFAQLILIGLAPGDIHGDIQQRFNALCIPVRTR